MADLSLAAQAVMDAIESQDGESDVAVAVAALCAAVDQVVPEQRPWHRTVGEPAARHKVRCKLLALATELKGLDSRPPNSPYLFDTSTKEQKPPPLFT